MILLQVPHHEIVRRLAEGWRLACWGAHEPHAQAAEYAVLMWRAEG